MATDQLTRFKERLARVGRDHGRQVMACPTLHAAHVYCVDNDLSGQQYGPLLERYIRTTFGYTKTKATEGAGDCTKNGATVEVKVSLGGASYTKFNYVQLRPGHNCDEYILTAYTLSAETVDTLGELYIFRVPKSAMTALIVAYGGYAHGTIRELGPITADSVNSSPKEYAIRPTLNDACWKALLPFRIPETSL